MTTLVRPLTRRGALRVPARPAGRRRASAVLHARPVRRDPGGRAGAGNVRRGPGLAALHGPRTADRGRAVGRPHGRGCAGRTRSGICCATMPPEPTRCPTLTTTWRGTSQATPRSTTTCWPAGIPLPEGVVTPSGIGCDDGDLAEAYYATWCTDAASAPTIDGRADAGPGRVPHRCRGNCLPGCPWTTAAGPARPRRGRPGAAAGRRATLSCHRTPRAGVGPGWPEPVGRTDVLAPPTVPWDRVLRAAVRRAVADRAGTGGLLLQPPAPPPPAPDHPASDARPPRDRLRRGRHVRLDEPGRPRRRDQRSAGRARGPPGWPASTSGCCRAMPPPRPLNGSARSHRSGSPVGVAPTCGSGSPPPRKPTRPPTS